MQAFFYWLFSEENSTLTIGLFDVWHFLYLFIILGTALLLSLLLQNRSERAKMRAVKTFACLTLGLYIADFFIMPLSDSYGYTISIDKLPFHICTLMGVLLPFVQFNPKFAKFKDTVVCLSIASSLMWMCYPGSALGGQPPFSYVIFQTFMYHGVLFVWGVLSLTLGGVRLSFKSIWKEFVGIICILFWAGIGNTVYPGEKNWFFISSSIFPFLSDEVMPIAVVACVFGVCVCIYAIYYGVRALAARSKAKKEA